MPRYDTSHFVFNYGRESEAKDEILEIAAAAESVYSDIMSRMGFNNDLIIEYNLHDNGHSVPEDADEDDNIIHAIYNYFEEKVDIPKVVKAMIAANIGLTNNPLIKRGLASYLSDSSDGGKNTDIVKQAILSNTCPSIVDIFAPDYEYVDDEINNALLGEFTKYLIYTYGMDAYKDFYCSDKSIDKKFCLFFGDELAELVEDFFGYIDNE